MVLYGDRNNWFAAYAYWYLRLYGHADARIMDGGRQKWIDEGRPVSRSEPRPARAAYTAQPLDDSLRMRRDAVIEVVRGGSHTLVDVRSPQEYSGELIAMPGYEQEGAPRGCCASCSAIPTCATTTGRGRSGATWSTSPSRRA